MFTWFRKSPAARMATRAVVAAVLGYLVKVLGSPSDALDAAAFAWGLAAAVVYALAGLVTPLEPLVGVKTTVEVPAPPARPVRP